MIEERATVTEVDGVYVWIETASGGSCGSCSSNGSCGAGMLGRALGPGRPRRLRLRNTLGAVVGDRVDVGIGEADLLRAALLLYSLPLLTLFIGAGLGQIWFGADLAVAATGALGLGLGLLLARSLARFGGGAWNQPRLLRRAGQSRLPVEPLAANRRLV
ncbi:MAG: SoxR reducing system RseC family protein [Chromatiales bacterium]|nr:SoxR reducing system RseC family protein [Chromatiales bacterium]